MAKIDLSKDEIEIIMEWYELACEVYDMDDQLPSDDEHELSQKLSRISAAKLLESDG